MAKRVCRRIFCYSSIARGIGRVDRGTEGCAQRRLLHAHAHGLHPLRAETIDVHYWTVPCVFALGLMSKPMLVTLPFILLLLDYWPFVVSEIPISQSQTWQCSQRAQLSAIARGKNSALHSFRYAL